MAPGKFGYILTPPALDLPQHNPSPGRDHRWHVSAVDHHPKLGYLLTLGFAVATGREVFKALVLA